MRTLELKTAYRTNVKQYTMILILVFITLFFQITTGGILLLPQNLSNLVQQNAYVVMLSVGMMLCILTGGNIDLSIGSVVAFIGAVCGIMIIRLHANVYLTLGLALVVSLAIGVWHGFWIARYNIPSFIATLSGMLVFRGLTYSLLNGQTYAPYPNAFTRLTTGFVRDYIGGSNSRIHATTIVIGVVTSLVYIANEIRKRSKKLKRGFPVTSMTLFVAKVAAITAAVNLFMYRVALYRGMPIVLIPVAVIVLVYNFIANSTVAGRHIYAVGGNQKAALLSGVNVRKVLFFTYVNMAFLSAVAGIVFTARLNAATPLAGQGFELDAIAACFIGGASAGGGVGTIIGALVGALVMGLLNNGLSILGIDMNIQMVIKGLILLLAVVLDLTQKNTARA